MRFRYSIGVLIGVLLACAGCGSLLAHDDSSFEASDGSAGSNAGSSGTKHGFGGSSVHDASWGVGGTSSGGTGSGGYPAGGTAGSAGGTTGGTTGTGGSETGGAAGTATGGSGGGTTDPYEAARQLCVDHINQLRATKGRPPYQRWTSAEACVDLQVTDDQKTGKPHNAWMTHEFACNGYGMAQNECLGGGAAGIVGCLDTMWAEKDQPGCSGCDLCTWPIGCPNCDFYGDKTGSQCGHYLNMIATWTSMAACGFSAGGSWAAINFQ